MKFSTKGYSGVQVRPFSWVIWSQNFKLFFYNETWYDAVFRGADAEFENYFLKFCP